MDAAFDAARDRAPWAMKGTRWARWGAMAALVGAIALAVPFLRGWADAEARLAADPTLCGRGFTAAPDDRSEFRRAAEAFFVERCE
ncbi:hypothetical protein JQC91_14225 [Jannaschia sp. Os4]|uniref:hypothetical protein n=1 Tax=Jannaschia sp. Os4 TaxID=2807617 RepID=UPI00193A1174|nr:hypothetical protein [Jannaschia sp. Os4]MBM2577460.1 hypothetical protein [Jannaschia sp. Os4]